MAFQLHDKYDEQSGYSNRWKEIGCNSQEITNDSALTRIVGPDIIRYPLKTEEAKSKNTEPVVGGFGVEMLIFHSKGICCLKKYTDDTLAQGGLQRYYSNTHCRRQTER